MIQIRVSNSPAGASKSKKKKPAKTKRQQLPLSTNVSSPAPQSRASTRPRSAGYDNDDDEDDDDDAGPIAYLRQSRARGHGYARGDFVVSDQLGDDDYEDNDDDGFEAVRDPGRSEPRTRQKINQPITMDERMQGMSEIQRDAIDGFVQEAKMKCAELMRKKNLRTTPFTDTMLFEMGQHLPLDMAGLRRVPGIDPLKVDAFGEQMLALTREWKVNYDNMMHGGANPQVPYDPNHQIVDLVSDDENAFAGNEDFSDEEPNSKFFGRQDPEPSTATANFNRQMAEAQAQRQSQAAPQSKKRPAAEDSRSGGSRKRNSGSGNKRAFVKKFAHKEKKGGDSAAPSRAASGGDPKRKTSSTYGANTGRAKSKGSTGGGGGGQRTFVAGGIGMMPT